MKPSNELRAAAILAFIGVESLRHVSAEAMDYLFLTLPVGGDGTVGVSLPWEDISETRPMRLLLAAEIAAGEGN